MEINDTSFCEGGFIDRSFLLFKILSGTPWLHSPEKLMVNRVNEETVNI